MALPEYIGKYQIKSELGSGNMGVVYLAHDPTIERDIAIKMIHARMLEESGEREKMLGRFQIEAHAVGQISHPNIVTIYDYDEMPDGSPYFVMELVEGRELFELIRVNPTITFEQMTYLMQQVLSGLGYTHDREIIHCDIKPQNIFVMRGLKAKIADFGIAKIAYKEGEDNPAGSPQYMSPEQLLQKKLDGRTDLFSAAVVFYELVTGVRPFKGKTNSLRDLLHSIMKDDPKPPSSLNPNLPKSFDRVILKALEKERDDRYQTAADFSEAITQSYRGDQRSKVPLFKRPAVYWPFSLAVVGIVSVLLASRPDIVIEAPVKKINLTYEESNKILTLLKVARFHFKVGRIVSPPGSSAFDAYNQVLKIDPHNRDAHIGKQEIVEKLATKIRYLHKQGEYSSARKKLHLSVNLFPQNKQLIVLQDELSD
ncbi:MAG: serine/threonine protein kinase [Methylococcales bacterium]|jgi:serine/threonine protein kinase|nr:serine/threonine protein kinase [Methylococcales bacterium]